MKQYEETVGIDVSKNTLDAHLHQKTAFTAVTNDVKGFGALVKWVKTTTLLPMDRVLWCFEYTGKYSLKLAAFLAKRKIPFTIVPPLEVKRSLGMARGKNDKVDAQRISEYAFLRRDKIQPTILPSEGILKIKNLLSLRERMVSQRAGYITSIKEFKAALEESENSLTIKSQRQLIKALTASIDKIEAEIAALIERDTRMKEVHDLLTSVVGIGFVVAVNLIVVTNCFTGFKSSRQLACYCGLAPFEKQSGTSLKTKAHVSHFANKRMKALLDRSAMTAILNDNQLRLYYERKIKAGKNPRNTINAVRNKILHRAFAVVKRGSPYVNLHRYAA